MRKSITNYELGITNSSRRTVKPFCLAGFVILLCLFSINLFAQNLSEAEIRQQANRLQNGDTEAKRDALHKLRADHSEEASRIATEGLTDKAEIVRATAPFSVLSLPADEAAENLLPQLKDKSEFVRRETAYALGETHSAKAVQPLVQILQQDKEYSVRCSAAVALGEIGEIYAADALIKILQNSPNEDNDFLRRSAARSIGQIAEETLGKDFLAQSQIKDFSVYALQNRSRLSEKYPSLFTAVNVLIKVLQNPKEADDTKREAAYALGEIGNVAAVPVLEAGKNDEDYYLADIARQALKKITATAIQ